MKKISGRTLMLAVVALFFGCSSDPAKDDSPGSGGGAGAGAGAPIAMGGSGGTPSAGMGGSTAVKPPTGGAGGTMAPKAGTGGAGGAGAGGAGGAGGAAGAAGGAGGAGGAAGAAGGGGMGGMGAPGNDLTGTLGALGPVKPVLNGWTIFTGLETITYLSSAPLSCADMMKQGTPWLGALPAGTQVIELVVRGTAKVGTTNVGFLMAEINYAEGSKTAGSEVVASSGSLTFTKADAMGVHEGTIMATYPMGMLSGTFHAEWCEGGNEY